MTRRRTRRLDARGKDRALLAPVVGNVVEVGVRIDIGLVDEALHARIALGADLIALAVEDDERDLHLVLGQKGADLAHGDLERLRLRKAEGPGGDDRERDRGQTLLARDGERGAVAGRKRLPLAVLPVDPAGADGVDDIPRGQVIALGEHSLSRRAIADARAGQIELFSRGAMKLRVQSTTAGELLVRGD